MKRIVLMVAIAALLPLSARAADYVIGAGDVLKVAVWGVPELSGDVVVRPDGKITLPGVGDILALGKTPEQLSQSMTRDLARLIKAPVVTVTVATVTNNRVYISGGGVPAQVLNLPYRTTVFRLLCTLPGAEQADLRNSYLMRDNKVIFRDFYPLFRKGKLDGDVALEPEDILFIASNERNKVYVTGAVKTPKYLIYREGMKVLDAVLESGGLTEFAKANRVVLVRPGAENLTIRLKDLMDGEDPAQNVELKAGDQIVVYEGIF